MIQVPGLSSSKRYNYTGGIDFTTTQYSFVVSR